MSDDIINAAISAITAAGGNSRAARSARAKLQWRDRYGRWIEMGRGVKFKVRFPDGAPRSVIGKFVGAKDNETGQVYVTKDPNGLPDGYYSVKSKNAQEMVADLSPEQLKQRGISVGQDERGNKVGERMSEDIPSVNEIERTDAPVGWKALPGTYGGKKVIETEDGEFRVHFGGKDGKWVVEDTRGGGGNGTAYSSAGEAFEQVTKADDNRVDLADDNDAKVAQLGRDELIDAIKLNERTINNDRASIDAKQRAAQQNEQIKQQLAEKGFDPYDPEGEDSDGNLAGRKAERARAATDTETPATESTQPGGQEDSGAVEDSAAPGAIDTDTFGVEATGFLVPTGKKTNDISPEGLALHIESEMDHYTEGGKRLVIDTDLGEAEGYNSAATFDDAKAQAGGVGVDHVLDLANNKVEQVDAPDNVDSSGTGDGTNDEVRSADAGESERADSGAAPTDDDSVGGEAESGEPAGGEGSGGSGSGGDRPADSGDAGDGDSGDDDGPSDPNRRAAGVFRKPDDVKNERDELAQERTRNQDALGRTGNRNVMEQIAKRLGEIETRLSELDQEDRDREDAERAPEPEAPSRSEDGDSDRTEARPDWDDLTEDEQTAERRLGDNSAYQEAKDNPIAPEPREEPVSEGDPWAPANEPGSVEEMKARRAGLVEALDTATHAGDIIDLNDMIDELDKKIQNKQRDDAPTPEEEERPFPEAPDAPEEEPEEEPEDTTAVEAEMAGEQARVEGQATVFEGLTPDRIAGDAPFVSGQPDFFSEGPAKSALEKVEAYLALPAAERGDRGMFDDLSDEEREAFNEATARDEAWVQANNAWSIEDAPEWRGPAGETAIEAWGAALNKPTGAEQRQAIQELYDSMSPQEADIFRRDRDRALDEGAGADLARVQPGANAPAVNPPTVDERADRFRREALERENNPNYQQIAGAPRGTTLQTGQRKYTSTGDGYWIDHFGNTNISERNLWERHKNDEMSFGEPDPADANLDMTREEWEARQARIEELETIIGNALEALDSGDFPTESEEADYWWDAQQNAQDELNELLISTPSEDELADNAPEPIAAPAMTEADLFDDGELPRLEDFSDDELVQARDILQNMVDEGRDDPNVRELLNRANEYLGEPNRIDPNGGPLGDNSTPDVANPGDDEAREEAQIFGGIEASELSDGLLRDEILNLEVGEREGVLTPEEEGYLQAYRDEMLRRQQAARAVNDAMRDVGIGDEAENFLRNQEPNPNNTAQQFREDDAFDDALADDVEFLPINGRSVMNPPRPAVPEYHVGDILRDENGDIWEVISVVSDDEVDVDGTQGEKTINPNEGYVRVFDREAELNERVFTDPASQAARVSREIDEEGWAERNPDQPGDNSKRDVLDATLQGKSLPQDIAKSLADVIRDPATSKAELDAVEDFLRDEPNAPNTISKPRRDPDVPVPPTVDPAVSGAQDDPTYNETFDIMWQGVLDAFPDALVSPEGDLIIDRIEDFHTPAKRNNKINKDYDLRIRRTGRNTAFVYILETDRVTGERKALRMSPETHSWDTFAGRVSKAQEAFKNPKLHITVSRSENTEHLGTNRDVGENPLREFLERGVRPDGPDEIFNQIANQVIDNLLAGEKFGKVVDGLRKMEGQDIDAVNRVAQAFIAQMMAPNAAGFRPRDVHISYDGRKVEPGMRFEWTDHRRYLDWYKDTMRPNPDYQQVYRGTVIRLKDEHSDGKGRRYGDDLIIQFDDGQELKEGGFKNTNWGSLASQAIRILDDDTQPLGEPFEAKREELRTPEAIAKAFNVPVAKPDQTMATPMPSKPRPKPGGYRPIGRKSIDQRTSEIQGFPGIRAPYDLVEAAEMLENAERTNKPADQLNPGDFYSTMDPDTGNEVLRVVLRRTPDGDLVTGTLGDGFVSTQTHTPGGFEYFTVVPNWGDIVETPDHIEEGALVSYQGKPYTVSTVGRGSAFLMGPQTVVPFRVPFHQIDELDDPYQKVRQELMERAEDQQWAITDRQELERKILDPSNTMEDFVEVGEFMNNLRPVEGPGLGALASLVGAVGLPETLLGRFMESLNLPGAEKLGNAHTFTEMESLKPDSFEQMMAWVKDRGRFEPVRMGDVNALHKGDQVVFADRYGMAVGTVLSDAEFGDRYTWRLEAIEDGRVDWNYGHKVGKTYSSYHREGTVLQMYRPLPDELMSRLSEVKMPVSEHARRVASAIRSDFKDVMSSFKGGWTVTYVPRRGAIHDIGQIIQPRDGSGQLFMKRAGDYDEMFPGANAQKEFLAQVVWRALGGTGVKGAYDPETRMFIMNAVNGDVAADRWDVVEQQAKDIFSSEMWRMALLDKLISNGDRNPGNFMYDSNDRLYPIDHGNAGFVSGGYEDSFAKELMRLVREGNAPLTTAQLLSIRNDLAAMLPFFESFKRRDWYDAVLENMEMVLEASRLADQDKE